MIDMKQLKSTSLDDFISVIIPIRNEENYIEECIKSILNFDYDKLLLEIIFIDGMSEDDTLNIIKKYQKDFPNIIILENKDKIVPIAMNLGIEKAKGKYICRLDAHARYPFDYLSKLLYWSKKLDADNVGAVCVTDIKKDTAMAKAIQFVMSDKFGVGNSLFRIGVDRALEVDTVPFGFYKKDVFDHIGLYDVRLIRTQDLELNKRLKKNGGKIYLIPDVKCTYYPREDIKSFFNNRFQTGRWVVLSAYLTNSFMSISLRHMVPLLFALTLLGSLVFGLFNNLFIYLFAFILSTYMMILFLRAVKIKKDFLLSAHILLAYFTLHFSYGLGSLRGLCEVLWRKIR